MQPHTRILALLAVCSLPMLSLAAEPKSDPWPWAAGTHGCATCSGSGLTDPAVSECCLAIWQGAAYKAGQCSPPSVCDHE